MTMLLRTGATDKRFYGVYEGIVTSHKDDRKEGRFFITVPRVDPKTELECRMSQFYAGDGFGAFWIPELKTEVLVAFIMGDTRYPIVIGVLYNGKDKPPSLCTSDKDEKVIRTKAGHQIVFNDKSGKETITITDKSGNNSILIDSVGDSITITAKTGKLKLSAKAGIDIESDGEINVKGKTINLN